MHRQVMTALATAALVLGTAGTATALPDKSNLRSSGDADGNGISDVGVVVTGHFESLYAWDANGDWFWDLGQDRATQGSVDTVEDLDQETLTTCEYIVHYRGTFENTPYQDSGWIRNNIHCTGYEPGNYNSVIVHESDPRYTGNPDLAIWGTWEYHVDTWSGVGNVVALPEKHVD